MKLVMNGKTNEINRDELLKDMVIFRAKHKVEVTIDW